MTVRSRGTVIALAAAVLLIGVMWRDAAELARNLGSPDWLLGAVSRAGPWLVIILLAVAIVFSPVPSGPIAMAAGALYGTAQGGCLVVAGASLGAMIAFCLSRWISSYTFTTATHPIALWLARPRSQNMLMLSVLATRLIPFISFDAVSYVAGLTPLSTWRFAVATCIGVCPVSFVFAGMGAGVAADDSWRLVAALACGITLLLPVCFWAVRAARTYLRGDIQM